jgi:hypothetical protein
LPPGFGQTPLLAKPFTQEQLRDAAHALTEKRAAVVRLRE